LRQYGLYPSFGIPLVTFPARHNFDRTRIRRVFDASGSLTLPQATSAGQLKGLFSTGMGVGT